MRKTDFITDNSVCLAPMAGVTSSSYRRLCMKNGASFCYSEMISAKALTLKDKKTYKLMEFSPLERPFGIQLFGYEPEIMAEAARIIEAELDPDFIDINMGCPAPKITGNKSGSALLREHDLACRITESILNACSLPVTAKMRLGWDSFSSLELAKKLEAEGVSAIAVHGRTAKQAYKPPVSYDLIGEIRKAVSIPVIANGDITDESSADNAVRLSDCRSLMIGRGSEGDPFIFGRIRSFLNDGVVLPKPRDNELFETLFELCDSLCEEKGLYIGIHEMRKHALSYLRGFPGAASLRNAAVKLETRADLEELVKRALSLKYS